MSSPRKCGQENGYSAFNVVAVAFPQIFQDFPPSFQIYRTRPPLLSFLEGSSSCWDANLRYASHVREDFHPRTPFHVILTYGAPCQAFTMYWQSPRTVYCPRTSPWPNILFWALTPTAIKHKVYKIHHIGFERDYHLKSYIV